MQHKIFTFLAFTGFITQITCYKWQDGPELIKELNHAVNQAGDKVREELQGKDTIEFNGKETMYLPYKYNQSGVHFELTNGTLYGYSSIKGANHNYLEFEQDLVNLSMTVNLEFQKILVKFDYTAENDDFKPKSGDLKVIAYNILFPCSMGLDLKPESSVAIFRNLTLPDTNSVGKLQFHINGRENNEFNVQNILDQLENMITAFAGSIIYEFSEVIRQEIENKLKNKETFINAVYFFYNPPE